MNLLIIIRVALRSLKRTALRSSLTALGVIIGVAAVIALLSIGNGARARLEEALSRTNVNEVTVVARMPAPPGRPWERQRPPPGKGLNFDDYRAIEDAFAGQAIAGVRLYAVGPAALAVKGNGRSAPVMSVMGLDSSNATSKELELVRGNPFSAGDVRSAASVCLVTQALAKNLFSTEDVLDRRVLVKDIPFRVIGIIRDAPMVFYSSEKYEDTRVVVPYTSLLRRIDRNATNYMQFTLLPNRPNQLAETQQRLSDLMESRRGSRKAEFITGNINQYVEAERENSKTLTLLLASIAGISLVVGGVGIMNIMLVSVSERTREIGIRLAIGTRDRDILRQFLIEAVILSVLGGATGIALGVTAAKVIGKFGELPTVITLTSVLGAFLCSAAIGIFFGWYPARQAARLDPIEALRAE